MNKNWTTRLAKLNKHFRVVVVAFIIIGGISSYGKFKELNAPDLRVFYTAAKHAVDSPKKVYIDSPDRFLYPPPAALVFTPLLIFPSWEWSKHIWYFFSLLIIAAIAWLHPLSLLAVILLFRYFVINLRYGQVNLLLLGTMFLCSILLWRTSKRNEIASGALLSLSSLVKLFPLVQLPELLVRKKWSALASFLITSIVLLTVPFLFWGTELAQEIYSSYPSQLQSKGIPTYTHNQSIAAFLLRFFGGEHFHVFSVGMVNWSLFAAPKPALHLIATIIGLVLSAIAWRKAIIRKLDLDFISAYGFTILFLSHIVWKPYFIFLLPALIQFLQLPRNRMFWACLVSFLVLGPLSSPDIWGVANSRFMDALSIHLIAGFVLFAAWLQFPEKNSLPFLGKIRC